MDRRDFAWTSATKIHSLGASLRPLYFSGSMQEIDWQLLQVMRQGFLESEGHLPNYWHDERWLSAYEQTLAQRIRWKWLAVLGFLTEQKLGLPDQLSVLDWGCGTGIASRSLLELLPDRWHSILLYDRSPEAQKFAAKRIQQDFPQQKVEMLKHPRPPDQPFLLLISHVLSELDEKTLQSLRSLAQSAAAVLWVEPGRKLESRQLSQLHDDLLSTHRILGPCRHQSSCGLLKEGLENDWCHFFAPIPTAVHHSAFWREFSKRMKIDLRSLPVAWLAAVKQDRLIEASAVANEQALILSRPRSFKGYCRWMACTETGISTGDYQKRNSKELFRSLSEPVFMQTFTRHQLLSPQEVKD
jgi:hypothetical protein